MFDRAVFVLGSPAFTFESAASSTARVLESFEVGEVRIFYSSFAEQEAVGVGEFAKRLFGVEVRLERLPATLTEAVEVLKGSLTGGSLAVPTAGSLLGAVALTRAADAVGASLAHVMFPFGPWTGFFYPYVPRYIQPILVLGGAPEVKLRRFSEEAAKAFLSENRYFRTRLGRRVAMVCLKLNSALPGAWVNDTSLPELSLELRSEVREGEVVSALYLKTATASVPVCELRKVKRSGSLQQQAGAEVRCLVGTGSASREGVARLLHEALHALAGGRKCLRSGSEEYFRAWLDELYAMLGFELLDLDPKRSYVVDTNLVYKGVHNVARPGGPRLMVPYCVRYEILRRMARSKSPCEKYLSTLLGLALEFLESQASRLPSDAVECDVAIPAVDPELVKDSVVLSADKRAVDLWENMVLRRYAEVKLVSKESFRQASGPELHFAILQTAAAIWSLKAYT